MRSCFEPPPDAGARRRRRCFACAQKVRRASPTAGRVSRAQTPQAGRRSSSGGTSARAAPRPRRARRPLRLRAWSSSCRWCRMSVYRRYRPPVSRSADGRSGDGHVSPPSVRLAGAGSVSTWRLRSEACCGCGRSMPALTQPVSRGASRRPGRGVAPTSRWARRPR